MNLAENLFQTTNKFPLRTAIVFYDRRINYEQCCDFVSRLAGALTARGLAPGDRLAIALPNVPEFIFAYYATLAAGGEIIPVNPLYTAREIEFMLRDSGAKFVITHPMFEQAVRLAIKEKPIDFIYSDNMGDPAKLCLADLVKESSGINPVKKAPEDTAVIAYTNACQGFPMGAQLTHGGLNFNAQSCRPGAMVDENDVFLSVIPLYHAFSATVCMNLSLANGCTTILNETFSEKRVIDILETEKISIFPGVPTIFRKLLEVYGASGKDFSSVKAFVPGGAPSGVDLIQNFSSAFNANMYEGYGITECGPVTSVNPIHLKINKIGSVGLPLKGITVKVCDEQGLELPPETQGELWVKGDNVMKNYLNQPDMTKHNLTNGWFHTGDRARLDHEGFIYLTGVIKRLILVGGFNVYPAEIERIIMEHPSVQSCRVFGEQDVSLGEHVAVEISLKSQAELNNIELKKFVRSSLAPYKTPRSISIQKSS